MMLAQAGIVTMGLVDTWCVGRVSPEDMAAAALGNALSMMVVVLGLGTAMGVEPLMAQAFGAGEHDEARSWRVQGLWATTLIAVPSVLLVLLIIVALPHLAWAPGFEAETRAYMLGRLPGVVLVGWFSAYRGYLTSVGRSWPPLVAVLVANVANVVLDGSFLFAFGWGAFGVGAATSLSTGVMLLVCWLALREPAPSSARRIHWGRLRQISRLAWPICGQLFAEMGIFTAVSTLIAIEGPVALSGHQIALNLSALTFMMSVGIGVGATARVGHYVGAGQGLDARRVGFLAMGLGALVMSGSAVLFFVAAEPLAAAFAPVSAEVRQLATVLLRIAAVFALSDGAQAVAAGALRGAGDTRSTFLANVAGHGLIGAPIGYALGIGLGWGAVGYWWGLTAGLTATAIALIVRFHRLASQPILRADGSEEGSLAAAS